jgi:hypothetical protein
VTERFVPRDPPVAARPLDTPARGIDSSVSRFCVSRGEKMRAFAALWFLALAACTSSIPVQPTRSAADEQALLRLHEAALKAHIDRNVDALLPTQADDFMLLNRGEISSPSRAERRQFLGPYLEATVFEFYRDAVRPMVKVSNDGSLGWVIAQVEARGDSATRQGGRAPLEFQVAWIELYEKRNGEWVSIGNASSFKGD